MSAAWEKDPSSRPSLCHSPTKLHCTGKKPTQKWRSEGVDSASSCRAATRSVDGGQLPSGTVEPAAHAVHTHCATSRHMMPILTPPRRNLPLAWTCVSQRLEHDSKCFQSAGPRQDCIPRSCRNPGIPSAFPLAPPRQRGSVAACSYLGAPLFATMPPICRPVLDRHPAKRRSGNLIPSEVD